MRKIFSISCFLSFCLVSFAQNIAKINNAITHDHQRVEGTKIYMVAPKNFEQVPEAIGFKQINKDNSIIVRESAGSYKSLVQIFMTENMTVKGFKIINQEKLMLNGDEATFFKLTQKVHRTTFTKFLLFFGDQEYCVLISAVFDASSDPAFEESMKKSLLSVAYKEEKEEEPMPKGFFIDFKGSGLKYARRISDAVIYSEDGSTAVNSLAKNSYFAGSGKTDRTDYEAFATERLQKQIKKTLTFDAKKPIEIDGLKGIEIMASTNTAEGKPRSLYQVLLFQGDTYYIMYGSATENTAAQMAVFQKIAQTFVLN
jgi:hypothetical protein